jgi:oxygen-independent coproporphyrinogen III oxidase
MAGIYLHIPYCKQACLYCNFHFSTSLKTRNDFVSALLKETELQREYLRGEPIETIYFGGGTPSLLTKEEFQAILEKLFCSFEVDPDAEITLEANPDDFSLGQLRSWKGAGINRLSIGVQSFFEEDLRWMNRAHTAAQAVNCIRSALDQDFLNISIDLIYGSPSLTDERWERNLATATGLAIPHLSCYALTLEPKTAMYNLVKENKMPGPDPDQQAGQFLILVEALEKAGYEHYEISNFALPGKRSRHNSAYWQGKKYLGLGPSAHSFDGGSRQWNIAANGPYIQSLKNNLLPFEKEELNKTQIINEYIMISLRTAEGIDLARVSESFGPWVSQTLFELADPYIRNSRLEHRNEKLILTKEGKLFADGIAAALFFMDHVERSGLSPTGRAGRLSGRKPS